MTSMVAARSLSSPVASLSKVRPSDARRLSKLGIETIRDLLLTLPFDWEIYGAPRRIAELRDGEPATVVGRISSSVAQALPLAADLEELLPAETRVRMGLVGVVDAVRLGHQPRTEADWQVARKRMAFAELFELQTAFALMRANLALEPATPIPYRQEVIDAFKAGLGFELTNAQRRSTWEAFQDMQRPSPMNRLLNGEVGSGKTAVAAACVAMAHAAGLQSVVMA